MIERRYSLSKNDDNTNNLPVVRTADEISIQAVKLSEQKREGFLAHFFPDKTQRAIIQGELAQVETEYEFRKRALQTLRETQLQNLTETCNQYLTRDKAARRADTAKFLLQKKEELSNELDIIFERFMRVLQDKYQTMESETNSLFRQIRQDKLEKDVNDFVELQTKLVDKFQRLIDEEV
jgi:seryl-tRNA(Sec) selenium transferase